MEGLGQTTRTPAAVGLEQILGGAANINPRSMLVAAAVVAAAGCWAGWWCFERLTTSWEREMLVAAIEARVPLGRTVVEAPNRYGDGYLAAPPADVVRYTSAVVSSLGVRALGSVVVALGVCLLVAMLLQRAAVGAGNRRLGDTHLRGARMAAWPGEIRRLLTKQGRVGDYSLAGVPLMRGRECQHILVVGTPGSGKSMLIKDLLGQIRQRGQRALVFDPECDFVRYFYREGKDVLLNPFDSRMPGWNIWDELSADYQLTGLARALFPASSKEPFFEDAARSVFEDVVLRLRHHSKACNSELYRATTALDLKELHAFLRGLPSARHVDPAGERKADSVLSTLVNRVRIWKHLPESRMGEGFSIRRFVEDEDSDRWIFLSAPESQMPLVRELLTLWTSIYVESVLSLPESRSRRIWTVLDELAALHEIRLEDLLARGRKRGACCVIGFQAIPQLTRVYGHAAAKTLRSSCSTWVIGRQADAESAEELSRALASAEVSEASESTSRSGGHRSSFSLGRRRVMRRLVLDSELMNLPDLKGYLRQLTLPITPVDIPVVERDVVAAGYEPTTRPALWADCLAEELPAAPAPAPEQASPGGPESSPAGESGQGTGRDLHGAVMPC